MLPGWRRRRDQCGEVPPAHREQILPFHRDVPAGCALADEMHPHAERRHRRPGSEAAAGGGARCPAGPGALWGGGQKQEHNTGRLAVQRRSEGTWQVAVSGVRGPRQLSQ